MTKANALLTYVYGAQRELSCDVAKRARSLAEELLDVAKKAEDPSGIMNSSGALQSRGLMLDIQVAKLAMLRQMLYNAESASDELPSPASEAK